MGKGIKRLREGGMVEWIYPVQPEDPPENCITRDTPFNKAIRNARVRGMQNQ